MFIRFTFFRNKTAGSNYLVITCVHVEKVCPHRTSFFLVHVAQIAVPCFDYIYSYFVIAVTFYYDSRSLSFSSLYYFL